MNASHIDTSQPLIPTVPGEGHAKNISPDQSLAAAVIEQAIEDYVKYAGAQSDDAREFSRSAKRWLFSKSTDVHSFLWWCEIIDINHDYVRRLARDRFAAHHGDQQAA